MSVVCSYILGFLKLKLKVSFLKPVSFGSGFILLRISAYNFSTRLEMMTIPGSPISPIFYYHFSVDFHIHLMEVNIFLRYCSYIPSTASLIRISYSP